MKKEFRAWNGQKFHYSNMGEYKHLGDFFKHTDNLGFSSPPTVYQQWTGLTDCNGRKIFEGDIVGCSQRKWEVVWNEGGFFEIKDGEYLWEVCKKMSIIGNIFENPELLN